MLTITALSFFNGLINLGIYFADTGKYSINGLCALFSILIAAALAWLIFKRRKETGIF